MGWKPCCCGGCEACKGVLPECIVLTVTGVAKGGGAEDDHLDMNGYHHLTLHGTDKCRYLCTHSGLQAKLYTHDGNFYLAVTDDLDYTTSGAPDHPFVLSLGGSRPPCGDMFLEEFQVPYNTDWHSRQTPQSNVDFSGATINVITAKQFPGRGMHCRCQRNPTVDGPCFGAWTDNICYASRCPWGGIRVTIENNNNSALDGVYDFPGPPCRTFLPEAFIGWQMSADDVLPLLFFMKFGVTRIGTNDFFGHPGRLYIYGNDQIHIRYSNTAHDEDCLSWDGSLDLSEYERLGNAQTPHNLDGGSVFVEALPYPPPE